MMKELPSFESKLFFVLSVMWVGFCVGAVWHSVENGLAHFYVTVLPVMAVFAAIVIAAELWKRKANYPEPHSPQVDYPEPRKPRVDYPRLRDRLIIIVAIPCVL